MDAAIRHGSAEDNIVMKQAVAVLPWAGIKLESLTRAGLARPINYMASILPTAIRLIVLWYYTPFMLCQRVKRRPILSVRAMAVLWYRKALCKSFRLC